MARVIGVAEHDATRTIVGKVHRVRSGRPPGATRNRSRYRTACGRVVQYGLPVEITEDTTRGDVCGRCFRGLTW